MHTDKTVICSDITFDHSSKSVCLLLEDQETLALEECKRILESKDAPKIISLVQHKGTFKIISCRRFGEKRNSTESHDGFYIENYLSDYVAYLDYLYMKGVDSIDEMPLTLDNFEVILKSIVSFYDVDIASKDWTKLVRVMDKTNGNLIFYSTEYTRPTLNVELLRRIRNDILVKFEQARNKPSLEEVAKLLKNNPRPSMEIKYWGLK